MENRTAREADCRISRQVKGRNANWECGQARLRVRMGFIVDVHQLADGCMRIFLRGGERLVAEEFLYGAEVSAVGKQVSGEGVTQRVWVQIPVNVSQADIFFNDSSHGALRKPAASVVQKNRFAVCQMEWARSASPAACAGSLVSSARSESSSSVLMVRR